MKKTDHNGTDVDMNIVVASEPIDNATPMLDHNVTACHQAHTYARLPHIPL